MFAGTAVAQIPMQPRQVYDFDADDSLDALEEPDTALIFPPSVYLTKSANQREAALITSIMSGALYLGASYYSEDIADKLGMDAWDVVKYAYIVSIGGVIVSVMLEALSISNEKKAAKVLGRIKVDSGGLTISF